MPRKIKRRRGPEITDRGAKELRGRLGLHEQAASGSEGEHFRRKARELTSDVFPNKNGVPVLTAGVRIDGAEILKESIPGDRVNYPNTLVNEPHLTNVVTNAKQELRDWVNANFRRTRR